VDDSDETVGKKIRNAELEKIPFTVVYGDAESDVSLAVREHGGEQSTQSLAEFLESLAKLSPWQVGA
jgi:threonyl-tRNA synthetase